jgi:acyl-CoA synthetase (AMP-forming)/AMP-acid ligase II
MARGIVRTHRSWMLSFDPFTHLTGITSEDIVWLPGPLTSTLYLFGAVHARVTGAQVRVRTDDARDATVMHGVPTRLRAVLADPPPRLRCVIVAGERCPEDLVQTAADQGIEVFEYYGSAETSFVGWRPGSGDFTAFPGSDVDVRDGLIWVRSPYLAEGYVYQAEVVPGPLRREGEWATVGDRGSLSGGGSLSPRGSPHDRGFVVLGRGDSAISVGGHTVVIDDVERLLREASGSDEIAVIGVPHPQFGEVVVAVIGRTTDLSTHSPSVLSLPVAARPKAWVTVDELPRTSGGKLDRAALRRYVDREVTWTPHR